MGMKNNDLINQESQKFAQKLTTALQEGDAGGGGRSHAGNAEQHCADCRKRV